MLLLLSFLNAWLVCEDSYTYEVLFGPTNIEQNFIWKASDARGK
jgi:hypothetical protein